MTTTAPPPATYVSGHCSTAHHDTCRGTYAGAACVCACHDEVVATLAPIATGSWDQLRAAIHAAYGSDLRSRLDGAGLTFLRRRGGAAS